MKTGSKKRGVLMVRTYKHQLVVHVASEVDRGQRLMQDRLLRWIAAYGHTASSFGFEFEAVGVITAKRPNMVSGSIMTGGSDDVQ